MNSRTRSRVRILAYHGVDDPARFARQMALVRRYWRPVGGDDVARAARGDEPLPARAVWVTFDDGLRSVVEQGLPVLRAHDVPATMFVCPGLLDSGEPHWWDVVETAEAAGIAVGAGVRPPGVSATTWCKTLPDPERRALVARLHDELARRGVAVPVRHVGRAELTRWLDGGGEVGNHTWDHPCLDRCTPRDQERQIHEAHEALGTLGVLHPPLFAYPNGNATAEAEATLAALGYDLGLVFDHRVATFPAADRFRVSRLRISAAAPEARFLSIVGGAHSTAFHARESARALRARSTVPTGGDGRRSDVDRLNQGVYEHPEVVSAYGARDELFPAEQQLVDEFLPAGSAVLDLGVGGGRTVPALSARASTYVGVDYATAMVEHCRRRFPGLDFRVLDASDLRVFPDASFDAVSFSFNGLDCLHPEDRRDQCIAEMARVLRPGGIALVSSHNARAFVRPVPPLVDPSPSLWRRTRRRLVQAYSSIRLVGFALVSRPLWRGSGYLRDTTSPQVVFAATPDHVEQEFERHGFAAESQLGASHPVTHSRFTEPWFLYAFRRTERDS